MFTTVEDLRSTCKPVYVGETLQRHFNRRGGAVYHVQACLRASRDRESSFRDCRCPVKLVQASLSAMK